MAHPIADLTRRPTPLGLWTLALLAFLLLAARPWSQDPPSFSDVLRGRVGQDCSAFTAGGRTLVLRFGAERDGARLTAVGEDFVQIRWANGTEQWVPLSHVEVTYSNRR